MSCLSEQGREAADCHQCWRELAGEAGLKQISFNENVRYQDPSSSSQSSCVSSICSLSSLTKAKHSLRTFSLIKNSHANNF